MGRILIALVTAASLAGCATDPAATPSPRARERDVPVARPAADGTIPVEEFAVYVEGEDPPWSASPLRSTLEFLGLNRADVALTEVVERLGPEGTGPATVTVTRSGLGDDSVQAVRYVLRFEAGADATWRLIAGRWGQRCAPGRGHQRFSPRFCV
jgi:hypothetical protein